MRSAIAILCTNDYWKGAKVLFHMLRKYGHLPDTVAQIALGLSACDFAEPVPIAIDYTHIPVNHRYFAHVADKFFALTLEYDRIIVLDADMLCLGDCSYLWSERIGKLSFYACRDSAGVIYYPKVIERIGLNPDLMFHAGTMVFQRDRLGAVFVNDLLAHIEGGLQSYDGGDQGYLNAYFQLVRPDVEIGYLPREYNDCTDQYHPVLAPHLQRIVHLTGPNMNPWNPQIGPTDHRWHWIERWRKEWDDAS